MKKFFLFFIQLTAVAVTLYGQAVFSDERTGIPISFTTDEYMYPESWRGGKINAQATPLNEVEYDRSKLIILKALEKYPTEVLTKHVKKVYVLDDIQFYGIRFGGTNSLDAVYILNRGLDAGYTDRFVEQLFHAEFSSILLRNLSYYLNKTNWLKCNADSFVYGGSGVEALRSKKNSEDFDEALHEIGFLNQYATSDFENDVNSFAKNIFGPKPGFWEAIDKYPRLRCKMDLLILFYSQIHVSFTETYFRKWNKY